MRVGAAIAVVWLIIGFIAVIQRGYFSSDEANCAHLGTIAVAVVAGPLNYVGVNPRVECDLPEPSP